MSTWLPKATAQARRKKGEPFLCPKCQQPMTHDEAYKHWAQQCPKRKVVPT